MSMCKKISIFICCIFVFFVGTIIGKAATLEEFRQAYESTDLYKKLKDEMAKDNLELNVIAYGSDFSVGYLDEGNFVQFLKLDYTSNRDLTMEDESYINQDRKYYANAALANIVYTVCDLFGYDRQEIMSNLDASGNSLSITYNGIKYDKTPHDESLNIEDIFSIGKLFGKFSFFKINIKDGLKYSVTINVKDSANSSNLSGAVFRIYEGSSCTGEYFEGTTDSNGNVKFIISAKPTQYCLHQVGSPDSYEYDNGKKVYPVSYFNSNKNLTNTKVKFSGYIKFQLTDKVTSAVVKETGRVKFYNGSNCQTFYENDDIQNGESVSMEFYVGNYSISLDDEYGTWIGKYENNPECINFTITEGQYNTLKIPLEKISVEVPKTGTIKIQLIDKSTNSPITKTAKIQLYNGKDCKSSSAFSSLSSTTQGIFNQNLNIGDYSYKIVPDDIKDYSFDESCKNVTVKQGDTTISNVELTKKIGNLQILLTDKDTNKLIDKEAKINLYVGKTCQGTSVSPYTIPNGNLLVNNIKVGDYSYKIENSAIMDAYNVDTSCKTVSVSQGNTYISTLTLEKKVKLGTLKIQLINKETSEKLTEYARVILYSGTGCKTRDRAYMLPGGFSGKIEKTPGDYSYMLDDQYVPWIERYKANTTCINVKINENKETISNLPLEKKEQNIDENVKTGKLKFQLVNKKTSSVIKENGSVILYKGSGCTGSAVNTALISKGNTTEIGLEFGDYSYKLDDIHGSWSSAYKYNDSCVNVKISTEDLKNLKLTLEEIDVDKEEEKEEENKEENKEDENNVSNPNTGFRISYTIIAILFIIGVAAYIFIKKKNKFPKRAN